MFLGRQAESVALDRVLQSARSGNGSAIVVHGEPGIGKSALLEHVVAKATVFRVLRTVGSEAEMEVPFAALQQLCAPALASLEQLSATQRDALGVAFGLTAGATPDRLVVGLAVLNLLSRLAGERPVLCVVDDAQWLDRESANAIAFAARRLATERIAVMFGARSIPGELDGLAELRVEGLDQPAALSLLRSALPDRLDEAVLDRIVAETRGNPLALLELPRGLTPAQLAGGFALPVSVPIPARIEASFRRRIDKLPRDARRLLLIAAAEPTGDPALLWRAAARLGIDEASKDAVEAEGLVELQPRVVFRHPLVRSAVYQAASPEERRQAHHVLAEATDAGIDPDRHAWHRSQATVRPDDAVARELELSAERAQARGGLAAAAAFMERSAELTVNARLRAGRVLVAAEAKRQAGALEAALALADLAERGPLDAVQRAELDVLRGRISFASERGNEAPRLLLRAAQRLELHDVRRARETYLDAITAAVFAGRLAHEVTARDVATAALAGRRPPGPPRASDLLLEGVALLISEGPATGTGATKQALAAFRGEDVSVEERLRWTWLAAIAAAFTWDYDSWDLLIARQAQVARDAGALAVLPLTLSTTAGVRLTAGQLSTAASLVEQIESVADATDAQTARYAALAVAAYQGHEDVARRMIDAAAEDFASRGEGMGVTLAACCGATLCNGLAHYDEAFAAATDALEDPDELWFSPWATVELIEAACRTRRISAAELALQRLVVGTSASDTVWGRAVEGRCRALLSGGIAAESLYRDALNRLAPTALRLDLARTHLVFGEWLRREHRPAAAREQLRAAHELFTEFGADGYAQRARVELRATGEHARKRTPDTSNDLTPQETRVAELVGQGATNAEIASQLFISPSTVEYHLHKVFRKLEVESRTQLARRMLDVGSRAS